MAEACSAAILACRRHAFVDQSMIQRLLFFFTVDINLFILRSQYLSYIVESTGLFTLPQ